VNNELATSVSRVYNDFKRDAPPDTAESVERHLDGADGPWFGLIHLMDTHAGYNPRDEVLSECLEIERDTPEIPLKEIARELGTDTVTGERADYWNRRYGDGGSEITTHNIEARYDGAVKEADGKVGRVLDLLQERGELDDTLVFALADHGESLTEHGIFHDHHGLYDVSIQIPLIVSTPGQSEPAVSEELVQITDIAPTIADYLETEELDCDGRSLRPLLSQSGEWDRDAIVCEEYHTQRHRAVRTRKWKYIEKVSEESLCRYCGVRHGPRVELFDIDRDPAEQRNLADERPGKARELADLMDRIQSTHEPPEMADVGVTDYENEEQILEHFEALGYR
jgi:arylsulfatase A-like enzyme